MPGAASASTSRSPACGPVTPREAAVARLGGHPVTFTDAEVGIGTREPAGDVACVLSGFHAALGARVFDHQVLEDMAAVSSIPIINLLSDLGHPCQALADLRTMRDELGVPSGPHRLLDR